MTADIYASNMSPSELAVLAVAAELAGFDGLWLGEHLMFTPDYVSAHPTHGMIESRRPSSPRVSAQTQLYDPLIVLASVAAATRWLRVGTAVYLVPLRHPLLIAQMTSTLQRAAGGRFVFGVGSGWLKEEFDARGVPFESRAGRLEEGLTIIQKAWAGEFFAHEGEYFSFDAVRINADPVDIPVIVGGNSDTALRRAACRADGWISSGTPSIRDAVKLRDRLADLREQSGRGRFETYFRLEDSMPETLADFRREGIDNLVLGADLVWAPGTLRDRLDRLRGAATMLGLEPRGCDDEYRTGAVQSWARFGGLSGSGSPSREG